MDVNSRCGSITSCMGADGEPAVSYLRQHKAGLMQSRSEKPPILSISLQVTSLNSWWHRQEIIKEQWGRDEILPTITICDTWNQEKRPPKAQSLLSLLDCLGHHLWFGFILSILYPPPIFFCLNLSCVCKKHCSSHTAAAQPYMVPRSP